jgi:hypothetical protein
MDADEFAAEHGLYCSLCREWYYSWASFNLEWVANHKGGPDDYCRDTAG